MFQLLPFMEQQALYDWYDQFDFNRNKKDRANPTTDWTGNWFLKQTVITIGMPIQSGHIVERSLRWSFERSIFPWALLRLRRALGLIQKPTTLECSSQSVQPPLRLRLPLLTWPVLIARTVCSIAANVTAWPIARTVPATPCCLAKRKYFDPVFDSSPIVDDRHSRLGLAMVRR